MAWNNAYISLPSDHRTTTPSVRLNIYEQGIDTVAIPVTAGAADFYEVRNYYGAVVGTGAIAAGAGSINLTSHNLPLGWYRIYYVRPTAIASPWGSSGGESSFIITRPSTKLPARPAAGASQGNDAGVDFPTRGYIRLGVQRQSLYLDSQRGAGAAATYLTARQADSDLETTSWGTADSARPLFKLACFPEGTGGASPTSGDQTQITNAVTGMIAHGVNWFEGRNEPNTNSSQTTFITELIPFSARVHAGGGSVLGPCPVEVRGDPFSDGGGSARWMEHFFQEGGGAYLDGISFHNYSAGQDIVSIRKTMDTFVDQLTRWGQHNKPRVNTEAFSRFACVYGSYEPRLQTQVTMLEMHLLEQYGVPKERCSLFYDQSLGFWDFPSWWINHEGVPSPNPLAAVVRVWSDELAGRAYASKLDFGTIENDHFIGSRFLSPTDNSTVTVLQSGGRDADVTLTVTGASSVTVSNAWGTTSVVPVVNGLMTVHVDSLPTYLRLNSGAVASPVIVTYGVDTVAPRAPFVSRTNPAPTTFPATATLVLPAATRVDTVIVSTPPPWQLDCGLLDFDVRAKVGGVQQVLATYVVDTKVKQWTSTKDNGACYSDSYWPRQYVWVVKLSTAVLATEISVLARTVSSGGTPDENTRFGFGVPGAECAQGNTQTLAVTIQPYLSGRTDGGSAVAGQPMLNLLKG